MSDDAVSREELERALRFLNSIITQMRDELLQLAAQVVTLTRALEERGAVSQDAVMEALPAVVDEVRMNDEASPPLRLELADELADKYEVVSPPIPCAELVHLCKARCCTFGFRLSTQDLDEGVVRWDVGRPYRNRRGADGYCVHHEVGSGCGVYQQRPRPCRSFDCRGDDRIWTDYDQRIPAPESADPLVLLLSPRQRDHLAERVRARRTALEMEEAAVRSRR